MGGREGKRGNKRMVEGKKKRRKKKRKRMRWRR